MALLEMGGKRFTLPQGEVPLGADPGSVIPLAFPGVLPRHAKLKSLPDGQVVISKAVPEAEVLINGVRLGAEPTPLLHGDKVELGGQELTFVDERRSGSTQYVQAMSPQALAQVKAEAKGGKATANTGGRVVSLTDGREYAVTGASLVFGRDASCDVVVAGKDVSRRHAEIVQTPKGYLLVDSSTNGTLVNDARIEGQRMLARADVITIGEEKFRFYADTAAPPSSPNPQPVRGAVSPGASAASPVPPPMPKLRETVHGIPMAPPGPPARPAAPPAPPARPASPAAPPRVSGAPLASFLARGGAFKGQRFSVKTPIVNIGRADYNDVVLPDESVSTSHAKLQRREGVWVLVDLDSTNGTFIDGDQIKGEAPLAPGSTVRFGEISLVFEPTDDGEGVARGGATKVMDVLTMSPGPARPGARAAAPAGPAKAAKPRPGAKAAPPVAQEKKGKGCGGSAAVLLLGMVGLAYWLFI